MKKFIFILLILQGCFTTKKCCGQKPAVLSLTTDQYPTETSWCLFSDSLYGDTIGYISSGDLTLPYHNYVDTLFINGPINTVVFLIRDTFGDGMNGSYFLSVCGDTIINKPTVTFQSGLYSTRTVPQCLPQPPPPPSYVNCVPTLININLDQFGDETSWDIKDSLGNIIFANGPYVNAPNYQPQFIPVCIPVGKFSFTIYDDYGDGLAGSNWGGQDGSYYIMQCGDTIIYGSDPNFGNDTTHIFISDTCLPPPPVPGCMDDDYVEYNPLATIDDSSCSVLKIYGCIDSTMFNYDSLANTMENIDVCTYDLILHDLVGNGWVGTRLEIYQEDDTSVFYMNSGFNQYFTIGLYAIEEVSAKLFVSQQAQNTALECGFTLIGPEGDTAISVRPPFVVPFKLYEGLTYCGNNCIEKVYGCVDSIAYNYVDSANISTTCYYNPGCISPAYLEYHVDTSNGYYTDINVQDSCNTLAIFGCMDDTMSNYNSLANVDNGGCIPYVYGCMDPLMYNYNSLATAPDTCIPYVYGCTDPVMYNYNPLANTDNGSCEPYVYGCTDSTMFNYNPLANANNNTCVPFIFGCTDPSMLNFNPQANTEDFSCIPYIYGCTDSAAFNYDSTANTDNGSCEAIVQGCMDQSAHNYNIEANVNDSLNCLYSAGCITGAGSPYWLNDPCYAWVIDVDDYCCENAWDTICQLTYNYCEEGYPQGLEFNLRDMEINIYPNPTSEKIYFSNFVSIILYNIEGKMLLEAEDVVQLDLSSFDNGLYNIIILYGNKVINKLIVKNDG
jgi:hypothetical protein